MNDAHVGILAGVEAPQTEETGPRQIWRKGEWIRPTAKNQTRGNLILHDQAESRRRRIAHWRPFQNVCWSHAPSGDTRTPAARAGSSDELGTRHASSPGTSQSPGAGEQRAGPRGCDTKPLLLKAKQAQVGREQPGGKV